MKKIFYLTLITMVTIFTLAISSTTTYAANRGILPREYWVHYYHGGFGTFSSTATSGDQGLHNMARAVLTDQLYYRLVSAFEDGAALGNQQGDTTSRNIYIPTRPRDFHVSNVYNNLGYSNHRGWSNVWRYQQGGNLGAGKHNDLEHMVWFSQFQDRTLTTVDGTISATISFRSSNTINVRLTRLTNAPSTHPYFRRTTSGLPIVMSFNRWNRVGTRVNDYNATDNLAIIYVNRGPFAAWDFRSVLQNPTH